MENHPLWRTILYKMILLEGELKHGFVYGFY